MHGKCICWQKDHLSLGQYRTGVAKMLLCEPISVARIRFLPNVKGCGPWISNRKKTLVAGLHGPHPFTRI